MYLFSERFSPQAEEQKQLLMMSPERRKKALKMKPSQIMRRRWKGIVSAHVPSIDE